MTDSKRCPKCGETKPLGEFGKDRHRSDGLTCWCKPCKRVTDAAYAKTDAARAASRARTKRWIAANKERQSAAQKAWREKNPAYSAEANRRYREANPGYNAAYHAADPGRTQERVRKRRAIKLAATVGAVDLGALWIENEGICQLCDLAIDPDLKYPDGMSKSVDHIVPLAKGGTHEQANLQWAHLVCNKRKGSSDPFY